MNTTLTLLGAFRLEHDGRLVRLATRKVESLFAFLALHPQAHPREKLAALCWGDSTDEQARHSLRTALASIRKELGDDILLTDRESIQLNPDVSLWVDVREFEQNAGSNSDDALELYRGDLLPDFYDEWVIRERERLRGIYIDTLLRVAQHHRERSEYAEAVQAAQKVLALDRANEQAHQHLIFCYAAQGDRIAALKQYDECQKTLREELNAEPSSETTALRDQIQSELTGAPSPTAELTNLPHPLTSFIGREKELRELGEMLAKSRLLTLTGAGGSGKTRLAIKVAREAVPEFAQGVWWVDLAALSDPALVVNAVAQALGVRESSEQSMTELLRLFIRDKLLLIVLDNCEHLVAMCADLAQALLLACPNLKILATSREALNLAGERVYHLPTLATPAQVTTTAELIEYESVRLFVERATAVKNDFALTEQDATAVKHICLRLDGIPLALELAAARVKLLSVEHIAARLDNRFKLLTGGARTALPRQQTLRATIDWSYDLLPELAQKLFRRLSVFAGGWTLEAAEEVCSDDQLTRERVLDELGRLVDRSLVVAEAKGAETRYRMLETIREYAQEKLGTGEEGQHLRDRHLDFFLEWVEKAAPQLRASAQLEWLARFDRDHDNLRAAFDFAIESKPKWGARFTIALLWFWHLRGYMREGRDRVARLMREADEWGETLERAQVLLGAGFMTDIPYDNVSLKASLLIARAVGDKPTIAHALLWLTFNARYQADTGTAREYSKEALASFRELNDRWGIAALTRELSGVAMLEGDSASAKTLLDQALVMFREIGDKYQDGVITNQQGELARYRGDYESAAAFYEESAASRNLFNRSIAAVPLGNWGWVALHQGDPRKARALFERALDLSRERGNNMHSTLLQLEGLAGVLGAMGKPEQAARLFGAVESVRKSLGIDLRVHPVDQRDHDENLAAVRAALEDATFQAAWADGAKMTLEQAIEYALANLK